MERPTHTALIADDDEFFRIAIRAILLERLGMEEVIETASMDEALERLGENHSQVAAALFDLAMPGMESPASLGAVRELFPQTRVIVVSASQRRQDVLAALEAGVHGYVPKGIGVDELTEALKFVLDGRVYVPSSLPDTPFANERDVMPPEKAVLSGDFDVFSALTPRQRDVLNLIVAGKSNKEIARALNLGEGTVKVHLAALFRNLGVNNRAAAAAAGARLLSSGGTTHRSH